MQEQRLAAFRIVDAVETAGSQRDKRLREIENDLRPLSKHQLRKRLAEHIYTAEQSRRGLTAQSRAVQQRLAVLR